MRRPHRKSLTTAYARRDKKFGPRKFVGIKLSDRTIAGVTHLKELFASKYSSDRCPTVSAMMNACIDASLLLFECKPSYLNAELKDFRERYATKVSR